MPKRTYIAVNRLKKKKEKNTYANTQTGAILQQTRTE